jgi:hypothetical protein
MSDSEQVDLDAGLQFTRHGQQAWLAPQDEEGIELSDADLPRLVSCLIRAHATQHPKRLDAMYIALQRAVVDATYDANAGRIEVALVYP